MMEKANQQIHVELKHTTLIKFCILEITKLKSFNFDLIKKLWKKQINNNY